MKMDIRLWLITTDHLEDGLWFREEDDFKVGMNYIAVLAASLDIAILAFSLMSNHVHFVVLGTETDANEFINEFKRQAVTLPFLFQYPSTVPHRRFGL